MCGFAGFVGAISPDALQAMTEALRHRGPDDAGSYIDRERGVHLGHRRLAIIDIAGGHQPMFDAERTVAVVFNGEIYNHAALRAELIDKGHRFFSDHSDTEVLVHGYKEWGETLPSRLNGMFAFAIHDRPARRLFLARDRFGEKPLYYWAQGELFVFGSELTALREHPDLSIAVDPRSLQKLLAYGFLPAPNALYTNSRKLPGGCCLSYDLSTHVLSVKRYWQFALRPDPSLLEAPEAGLAEELRALLKSAVGRRLEADVPLGVFLSGGIDSSTILALSAEIVGPRELGSFSIGFEEPSFDESAYARAVAEHVGCAHHARSLPMSEARALIPKVLGALDEPLGDASILPTYLLCEATRRHVTVALSGDGGDELFAGYDPFRALAPALIYDKLMPRTAHRGLRRLAELLPLGRRNMSLDFKLRRALAGVSYPPAYWNPVWLGPVEPRDLPDLFMEPVHVEEVYREALELWERSKGASLLDRTLEFYTNLYLPDDILTKVDRASMMVSLESRAVFLDNDLVDFCMKLPAAFKYRRGTSKYLLRKAARGLIPDFIVERKKKGFGVPTSAWLRRVPEEPPMRAVDGVRMPEVARRWREHRSDAADHRLFLWSWLSLQYAGTGASLATPR